MRTNVLEKTGRVKDIFDIRTISVGFSFQEIVVESCIRVGSSFMISPMIFKFVNSKIGLLDGIKKGDVVMVRFDIIGKEARMVDGSVRYYNNLEVWDLSVIDVEGLDDMEIEL